MLGLQHPSAESPKQYSANVLPCRINHNGSVNSHARFWHPQRDELDHPVSHLRGRRLQGREVTIPTGYRGLPSLAPAAAPLNANLNRRPLAQDGPYRPR